MISRHNLPEIFNCADFFLDRHVREGRGEKTAIRCDNRTYTYAEIKKESDKFGNTLQSQGVRMEERVALLLNDTEVYPVTFFGAIKIGAVPVCMNTLLRPKDYAYILNDCRARILVVDSVLLENILTIRKKLKFLQTIIVAKGAAPIGCLSLNELMTATHPHDFRPAMTSRDDQCFWLYSSGTTGQPKGVVHLQHDMVYVSETYAKHVLKIQEDDICFSAAKLFFAYGLGNGLFFPFSVGTSSVYLSGRPTPTAVFETINQYKPTIFFGVPTLYAALLEEKGTMESVRICVSAGEALPAIIFKKWKERFGIDIIDGIGSTEMAHIFISNNPDDICPGSSGKLVPGYEARIVNEDMEDVSRNEVGTLLVKGDSSAPFYWNQHEKTKETMLGDYLNTGDKFMQDEAGYFHFVGRTDDMLKVGGIWVSPVEVEACIIEHQAVLECAVIGFNTEENLVKPKAYVVLKENFESSKELSKDIQQFVKTKLAHYKYPRQLEFVGSLPKTATGKIKRFELRDQCK